MDGGTWEMQAGMRRFYIYILYQVPYHHAMRLNGRVMVCDRRGDGADEDD